MENISFPSDENIIIPNKAWFRVVLFPNIQIRTLMRLQSDNIFSKNRMFDIIVAFNICLLSFESG